MAYVTHTSGSCHISIGRQGSRETDAHRNHFSTCARWRVKAPMRGVGCSPEEGCLHPCRHRGTQVTDDLVSPSCVSRHSSYARSYRNVPFLSHGRGSALLLAGFYSSLSWRQTQHHLWEAFRESPTVHLGWSRNANHRLPRMVPFNFCSVLPATFPGDCLLHGLSLLLEKKLCEVSEDARAFHHLVGVA